MVWPLAELTLQSLRWLPIAVVAAAVAIGGTWWLYRPQLQLRTRGVRVGLPILRSMALVVLAIALIKPVVLRAKTDSERGTLLVLIDRSASMNVVDGGRSPAQLIALADGLKLLPASVAQLKPQITQGDVDQYRSLGDRISRAASELDYAKLANRGVEAAQTRLDEAIGDLSSAAQKNLDRIKSDPKSQRSVARLMALLAPKPNERDAWLRELQSRIDRAAAVAADSENNVADQLYKDNIEVRVACEKVAQLSRLELAKLTVKQALGGEATTMAVYGFASGVAPISLETEAINATTQPTDPTATSTDITGAVRAILQKYPPGTVRGVVLLSDGRQVGSQPTVETIAALAGDVRLYTVRMAKQGSPKDVTVARVSVPNRAFVGETVNVRVELRSAGIRGEVPITFTAGDKTQTKPIRFTDDGAQSAEFSIKLDQAGPLKISATATPQLGEISTANNAMTRWVNVLSDKVRVVAIAQSAGRDFQFFRDALSRTQWVTLEESIAAGPGERAKLADDALNDADLVVIEDAGPNLLSAEQWAQVRKLVAERGTGAILLAGEAHSPGELLGLKDAEELLPIAKAESANWRTWAGEWPSLRAVPAPRPPGAGRLPEALRLTDDLDASLRKWQELPAMYRLMNLAPLKPNASPLLVDSETKAAVMTESRVGAGRVAFVGLTETWRWRYKIGQRDQDRFWLQLVRQVSDEPYASTAGSVSLDADRLAAEAGKPIKLRARIRTNDGKPSDASTVSIKAISSDSTTKTEILQATAPGSGRYEKSVNGWPAGEYQVSMANSPITTSAEAGLTLRIATSGEGEMANLSGDSGLLRRLADATGGRSIAPEQLADLPAQLAERAAQHPQVAEIRLWDSPYLFAFVLACLGLEWAVRKQAGLA